MRYKAPRGTHDILPQQVNAWRHVETTFADLVESWGYQEIRTPMFEETDLFIRASGETSDMASKQMYSFLDKGGRDISLKPEGTAPVARAVVEHNLWSPGQTLRLYYATPIFRYERPQKGRYRQAHQVGLELIGPDSAAADAEIIELTIEFFRRIGIADAEARLNALGSSVGRAKFRASLLNVAGPALVEMDAEARARYEKNPLRLLDSKDPVLLEALSAAPPISDFWDDKTRRRFDTTCAILSDAGVTWRLDTGIVRGLDYYTGTVFEVHSPDLGAQSSLCGGGRYDELIEQIGGPAAPSVGVAMGVERTLMVLEARGIEPFPKRQGVWLVAMTDDAKPTQDRWARTLRAEGIPVWIDLGDRSPRAQVRAAEREGWRYVGFLGDDEIASGNLSLKDLSDGRQDSMSKPEVLERLKPQ